MRTEATGDRGRSREYEDAARYALAAGRPEFLECLLVMAEVEWEHELYFRSKVTGHALLRLLPLWSAPPPKESIGAGHAARSTEAA